MKTSSWNCAKRKNDAIESLAATTDHGKRKHNSNHWKKLTTKNGGVNMRQKRGGGAAHLKRRRKSKLG